jgi:hypothetical protein
MVFTIFCCIFVEEIITKVVEALLKSLANYENPSSNALQEACSGFQTAACDSKNCSVTLLLS